MTSARFIAQVKNYAGSVSAPEARALLGVAVAEEKAPLLFTSGTLTADAAAFADKTGIAAFKYSAEEATIEGLNALGAVAVEFDIPTAMARCTSNGG